VFRGIWRSGGLPAPLGVVTGATMALVGRGKAREGRDETARLALIGGVANTWLFLTRLPS
jgi:hypothetical protein